MRKLFRKIERLARSSAPVITSGKAVPGRSCSHDVALVVIRKGQLFIAVNCGAIAENLIESELSGTNAQFHWASRTHRGCSSGRAAERCFSTITEMPLEMQVRLCASETGRLPRRWRPEIDTDVRILRQQSRLQQAVASGRLREDLMYRLCVIPVTVPPLRERDDDALLLAAMFLQQLNGEHDENKRLSDNAKTRILEYCWPGNVRELKNVIHRAFVLSDDEVFVDMDVTIRPDRSSPPSVVIATQLGAPAFGEQFSVRIPVGMSLDAAEKALITATLQAVSGSKAKAAQVLGISLKTLYNRLHAYDDAAAAVKSASSLAECTALAA
jgi:DNA-binding NtrC family response regulator